MNSIYIASKGRHKTNPTIQTLRSGGIDKFKVFVEPQEYDRYTSAIGSGHVVCLERDDAGLAYVRQFIKDYADKANDEWFWMFDDDVSGLFETINSRNVRTHASEVISKAESILTKRSDIAIGALEYQQYAWSAKKDISIQTYTDVCVLINTKRTRTCKFRDWAGLKVDRDFTLQCLSNGYKSAKACKLSFAAPKNGSNDGGLSNLYAQSNKESSDCAAMVKFWGPSICQTTIKKDGRVDLKINWKHFKI